MGRNFKHRPESSGSGVRLTALAREVALTAPSAPQPTVSVRPAQPVMRDPPAASTILPPPRRAAPPRPRRRYRAIAGLALPALVTLLASAGLSLVGGRLVDDAVADHRTTPTTPSNILALSDAGAQLDQRAFDQIKLKDGAANLDGARRDAEQALRLDPLDARAVALLALIADRRGNHDRADELMNLAAQRTFHDPLIESWMLLRSLQLKDFESALSHADVLLRTHEELRPLLVRMFVEMTGRPTARVALVNMLSTAPPWRRVVLHDLSGDIPDTDRLIALYQALRGTANPPTVEEMRPYLARLIENGRYRDAYREWTALASRNGAGDVTARPYDGDFSVDPRGTPFDWTLASVPGARIDIVPTPDGGAGRALRVQFSGARVSFENVSQLLMLSPGTYHLNGLTRASDLQTSRGLQWRISCAEQPDTPLGETGLVSGTMPWTSFGVDFQVPPTGCRAQWLRLELPARTATEHQIAGEVWYRNLHISAETAEVPEPAMDPPHRAEGAGG